MCAVYASKGNRLEDFTVPAKSVSAVIGSNAGAGLSPSIWNDCPLLAAKLDPFVGYGIEDDFMDVGLAGTITTIISDAGLGRYLVFGGAGATAAPDNAAGGGLTLSLTDSDQAVSLITKQNPFQITSGAGDLWFEARVKFSTITTNEQAWMVGLTSIITQSATVPLTALGAIADVNFVGFHKPEANTTAFDASYKANGVNAVEVNSDIGTLAVDTYVKLGMRFSTANNQLIFFVNGSPQATAKTVPNNTGTDFPADVLMAPTFALLAATNDTESGTIDWWKCYQLRA
jgi:hypothetical protein